MDAVVAEIAGDSRVARILDRFLIWFVATFSTFQSERNNKNRKSRSFVMKQVMIPLFIGSVVALTTTEASAVVYCVFGVYQPGCVARPVFVAPRAVVVAPRPVVVAPRGAVVVAPRRRTY